MVKMKKGKIVGKREKEIRGGKNRGKVINGSRGLEEEVSRSGRKKCRR